MPQTIREFRPTPVVGSDGTFPMQPVAGAAMSFTPAASNVGGFPLVAWWNGDTTTAFVIRGPQWLQGNLDAETLTVDATLGGGKAGDRWQVTIAPAEATVEQPRLRTDMDGMLQVRAAGARELFNITLSPDTASFSNAWGNGEIGSFAILNSAPTAFTPQPVDATSEVWRRANLAWDVSRFSHLLFVCDVTAGTDDYSAGPTMELGLFIDACHSPTSRSFATYGMGTLNNFGSAGTPWNGDPGALTMGAPTTSNTQYTCEALQMPPFLRFRLVVGNSSMDATMWNDMIGEQGNVIIRAVAW